MQSRAPKHILPTLLALLLAVVPVSSFAQAQQGNTALIEFSLPAGNLGDVLNLYSRQAGVTLSFDENLVETISVPALFGSYRAEEALLSLLRGTNLQAVPVGSGAWLIQSAGEQDLMVLDSIQVETRDGGEKDQAFRESASVNILTQENIERFRGTSVGDIFQGTPGVLISENRNSGGLDVNIRGMQGQGRVPVLIDGSRQETTIYRGYAGVSSRSYIDPDLIGSLRIDKGPVMGAEGTGATGGVVSVNTLRAEDVVKPGELSGFRVRVSGIGNNSEAPEPGTYAGYYLPRNAYRSDCRFASYCTDDYAMPESFAPDYGMDRPSLLDFEGYAASFAGAQRFEWGDLVVAHAQREQGNYYAGTDGPAPEVVIGESQELAWYTETPVELESELDEGIPYRAGERIPNTNFSSDSWLLKSNFYLPKDQSFELGYIRYKSTYGEMMPSQVLSTFGQARQWLDSEVLNQTYTARYRWQPVEYDWADLHINFWHTDAVTDLNTPSIYSIDLEDNTARTDDYQRFGLDITNSMRFYPMGELRWDYGVSAQWEDLDSDTLTTEGFYDGSRSGSRDEYSVFTSIEWQPWPEWTLESGVRYTHFSSKDNNPLPLSIDSDSCIDDGEGGCEDVYYNNSHSGTAPMVVLTWEPIKGLQFYARHAQALRMPSLFEGTSGFSVSPALDISLKPEHAKNNEVGINYLNGQLFEANHQIQAKLAYFENQVDNYITRTRRNSWEDEQGGGIFDLFRMRNIESLDLKGVELNLGYDAHWWLVELSGTKYSHIEACNIGSGVRYYCADWGVPDSYFNNMVPPNWHASAHFGLRLFQKKLELGLRGTFVGERNAVSQYGVDAGFTVPVEWPSYQLLDVYTSYQFNDSFSVDFTVDNVTDKYYVDALSLGLVPSPGRTARLSLTYQY
ncbi:TonB-dependent receptor [Microbulbifer sp. A4B17]|uniref:TonB-dependent receptor n=1 Tax=Microbulbifer sp. A4B17 TaxID=359370 RepID=UPI000D52E3D7|nr:TonB-dependent receptor [Microbulbifer sp. A4B17]AWF80896.1 TonB-dependent receptor [Microbulbifer sp. A4B17]